MPIPADEWKPIGKRIPQAWLSALAILEDSGDHFVDFADLIPAMCEAGSIEPTTAANILHRAVAARIVERRGRYDFRTHRGRLVRIIYPVPDEWKYIEIKEKKEKSSSSKENGEIKVKSITDPSRWSKEEAEKAFYESRIDNPEREGDEFLGIAMSGKKPAWRYRKPKGEEYLILISKNHLVET